MDARETRASRRRRRQAAPRSTVAPPNRSARVAVLGSSLQRSKPSPYPSRARAALSRRLVLAVLVLVALALLTISFRSPAAGALHDLQGYGASALRPFQIAAPRVARPLLHTDHCLS